MFHHDLAHSASCIDVMPVRAKLHLIVLSMYVPCWRTLKHSMNRPKLLMRFSHLRKKKNFAFYNSISMIFQLETITKLQALSGWYCGWHLALMTGKLDWWMIIWNFYVKVMVYIKPWLVIRSFGQPTHWSGRFVVRILTNYRGLGRSFNSLISS